MPATVFTLAETTDRTGYVLGVFTNRRTAIDVARGNAAHRATRCRNQDVKSFGASAGRPGDYEVVVQVIGEMVDVSILHTPSGERDDMSWHIRAFEVVDPSAAEAVQSELFPVTA